MFEPALELPFPLTIVATLYAEISLMESRNGKPRWGGAPKAPAGLAVVITSKMNVTRSLLAHLRVGRMRRFPCCQAAPACGKSQERIFWVMSSTNTIAGAPIAPARSTLKNNRGRAVCGNKIHDPRRFVCLY